MCRRALLVFVSAVGVAIAVAAVSPAYANGRMPATSTVHFRPGSTTDVYVGATWGLIFTSDGGATWRWVCEQAVGYGGAYDPDYVVTAGGALWATTLDGLRTTSDGCVWTATEKFGDQLVSSVTVGPDDAIWVSAADAADSRIYRSTDGGDTFQPTGTTGADVGAWWESLEVAPSRPQRAYASGYRIEGTDMKLLLLRTDNSGARWDSLSTDVFAVGGNSLLQIASISPDDPDLLLARITRRPNAVTGDAIYRSTNGGTSWTLVHETDDDAPGVAIRRLAAGQTDARTQAEVLIGTRKTGTVRSTDGGVTYVKLPRSLEVGCLAERPEDRALFACGNNLAPDMMALARSTDGLDWTAALEFRNVTAPATCGADTVQRMVCQDQFWCGFKAQLGITSEVLECPGGVDAPAPPKEKDGCDCRTGGGGGGMALLGLVLAWGWRRRVSKRGRGASKVLY